MTKASEERMLQKGVYTGIMEKDETTFFGVYLLDYKMAQNTLGDWITIKSIIENRVISVIINIKKSKTSIKQTTNHSNSLPFNKKITNFFFEYFLVSNKKIKKSVPLQKNLSILKSNYID
jgi:hypothetical protein